jgi:hypothetical protein
LCSFCLYRMTWMRNYQMIHFLSFHFILYFRCRISVKLEPAVMSVQELSASASTPTKEVGLG